VIVCCMVVYLQDEQEQLIKKIGGFFQSSFFVDKIIKKIPHVMCGISIYIVDQYFTSFKFSENFVT
jgi:hypothetical protein